MSYKPSRHAVFLVTVAVALLALLAATPALSDSVDYASDCPMIPSCYSCFARNRTDDNSSYYCTQCNTGFALQENATSANEYCLCSVTYCNVCATDGSGKCATDGCVSGTTYKDGACVVKDSTAGFVSVFSAVVVTALLMFAF